MSTRLCPTRLLYLTGAGTFELGDLRLFGVLQLFKALLVLPQGPAMVLFLRLVLLVELVVLLLQVLVLVLQPQSTPSINLPSVHPPKFKSIDLRVLF